MTRQGWRNQWRADRIVRREVSKAIADALLSGSGFTRSGDLGPWRRDGSDVLQYIPVTAIRADMETAA